VVSHPRSLGCLQQALPSARDADLPIALAREALQAMDLAFGDAVIPMCFS
jgi:hypothetical protein